MREVKPPQEEFDVWFDVVLRLNAAPHWLSPDAPASEVVLSSRARLMRNLAGLPFPHACTRAELEIVQRRVGEALTRLGWSERRSVSDAEKAVLVGSRLVSPDFGWGQPGRSAFLSPAREACVMANEEDHIRIQAVMPGFSLESALRIAEAVEHSLQETMEFAQDSEFGHLAASVSNAGSGRRLGAMLHLPCTALSGAAPSGADFDVRGLLGEMSTGIGAFVQVSSTSLEPSELQSRIALLIDKEHDSRRRLGTEILERRVEVALERIQVAEGLNLQEAVNAVSWLRAGAVSGLFPRSLRELDSLLALLNIGPMDEPTTNLRRQRLMRRFLELTLPWPAS